MFEIVHQQSVKVYLHVYDGNVQQNPLCAASSVTKDIVISPRFSPTTFYRDANSVLYSAQFLIHLAKEAPSNREIAQSSMFSVSSRPLTVGTD